MSTSSVAGRGGPGGWLCTCCPTIQSKTLKTSQSQVLQVSVVAEREDHVTPRRKLTEQILKLSVVLRCAKHLTKQVREASFMRHVVLNVFWLGKECAGFEDVWESCLPHEQELRKKATPCCNRSRKVDAVGNRFSVMCFASNCGLPIRLCSRAFWKLRRWRPRGHGACLWNFKKCCTPPHAPRQSTKPAPGIVRH